MASRVVAFTASDAVWSAVQAALGGDPDTSLRARGDDLSRAADLLRQHRPDVLILDLDEDPDARLEFLRRLMQRFPVPVVVLARCDGRGSRCGLRAMELGAIEAVDVAMLRLGEPGRADLLMAVHAAHAARATAAFRSLVDAARRRRVNALKGAQGTVIAIGASTGGTEALHRILPLLPEVTPGILVTQHMPAGFTAAFAEHLNHECQMEVREARDGDRVRPGLILIAPGDRHMRLRRSGGLMVGLGDDPPVNRHRPSVDVLFESVAEVSGPEAVGVILTGMGADGAAGLRRMRERGAVTIAQDEATCVVYGMPREAVAQGGAGRVLPLDRIPPAMLHAVLQVSDRSARAPLRTA